MPQKTFNVGDKVMCNGFQGAITLVCTGQLEGMVEVRMDRGSVCVAIDDVGLYRANDERSERLRQKCYDNCHEFGHRVHTPLCSAMQRAEKPELMPRR